MQKSAGNVITAIVFWAVTGSLFVFCAYESVKVIQLALPSGDWPLSFFGLGALDGGSVLWMLVLKNWHNNQTEIKVLAGFMVMLDFICSSFAWIAGLAMQAANNGIISKIGGNIYPILIIGVGVVIAFNIGAGFLYHGIKRPNIAYVPQPQYRVSVEPPRQPEYSMPPMPIIQPEKELPQGQAFSADGGGDEELDVTNFTQPRRGQK